MPFTPRRSAPTGSARTRALAPATLAVVALALASACTSDSPSGTATPGVATAAGADIPLPTIGLGSDTGSSSGQGALAVDGAEVQRVVMVGDSITVGATPYLTEYFASAGLSIEIGAQEGKRINVSSSSNLSGTRVAEQLAIGASADGATSDELWVVALGTNDIGQFEEQADVEAEIRELLTSVPSDAPLVWINTWFRDRPDFTAQVNAAIRAVMTERGNATIGDWASVAPTEGVLRSDGVHPNDDGAKVFAELVLATSRGFLQR